MSVGKKIIAAISVMIVSRRFASGGKNILAQILRSSVALPVRQQHLLRIGQLPAHEKGVTDFLSAQRLAGSNRGIFAARTDKRTAVHGVAWHQQRQRLFGSLSPRQDWERAVVIV